MTIEQRLHLNKLGRFEKWLDGRSIIEARDYQGFVDRKLESLARQLWVAVDLPSWGPRGPSPRGGPSPKARAHAVPEEDLEDFTSGTPIPAFYATVIDHNLELSQRIARFTPLYVAAAIIGVVIMVGALSVDFLILNEFWTRAMFPDFARDLAKNFGGSAFAKSLQVVFATIAFHFFLSNLGPLGRKIFISALFLVALTVVLGLGVLNAGVTGPAHTAATEQSDGFGSLLQDLGVAPPASAPEQRNFSETVQQGLKDAEQILWIVIPSVIFLIVTGIAALSLQMAETNLVNFVRSRDWQVRRKRLREMEEMQLLKAVIDRLVGESHDSGFEQGDDDHVVPFPGRSA